MHLLFSWRFEMRIWRRKKKEKKKDICNLLGGWGLTSSEVGQVMSNELMSLTSSWGKYGLSFPMGDCPPYLMKAYICAQITLFKIPVRGPIEEILLSLLFSKKSCIRISSGKVEGQYLKKLQGGIDYLGESNFRVWPSDLQVQYSWMYFR